MNDEQIPKNAGTTVPQVPPAVIQPASGAVQPPAAVPSASVYTASSHTGAGSGAPRAYLLPAIIVFALLVLGGGGFFLYHQMNAGNTEKGGISTPALQPASGSAKVADTPSESAATKNTADPKALVSTDYDNGEGGKYSLLFYNKHDTVPASTLPSDSFMRFVVSGTGKNGVNSILRQTGVPAGTPGILLYIGNETQTDASKAAKSAKSENGCGKIAFTAQLNIGPVNVCDNSGSNKSYSMTFSQGSVLYWVQISTSDDGSLLPFDTDLKKILPSIVTR